VADSGHADLYFVPFERRHVVSGRILQTLVRLGTASSNARAMTH
jgi:hypothetical protein